MAETFPVFEANVFIKKDLVDATHILMTTGRIFYVTRLEEAVDILGVTHVNGTNATLTLTAETIHHAVEDLLRDGYKINYIQLQQ